MPRSTCHTVKTVSSMILAVAVLCVAANAEPLQVGERAPDFRLPATTGGLVSLSDYVGTKMVLIEFYHADWAPTCMANAAQRRDDYPLFAALGVEVLAISISHTYSQHAFAESLRLPFPLLSDYPNGDTIRSYGVDYLEGTAGRLFARPSFFLVDRDGFIIGYWGQRPLRADDALAPDPLVSSLPMLELAETVAR